MVFSKDFLLTLGPWRRRGHRGGGYPAAAADVEVKQLKKKEKAKHVVNKFRKVLSCSSRHNLARVPKRARSSFCVALCLLLPFPRAPLSHVKGEKKGADGGGGNVEIPPSATQHQWPQLFPLASRW